MKLSLKLPKTVWLILCIFTFAALSGGEKKENVVVTPELLELLSVTHVSHDGSLQSIVQGTQKKWLRPAGKERWEIPDVDPNQKRRVLELASKMGFMNSIDPASKEYRYGVVLGATVERMQLRLKYLAALWDLGVRFEEIVFLTGERPLDPSIETVTENYKTETAAAHYIFEHARLPRGMRTLPVTFVDVPMFQTPKGPKRPTTADTYVAWMQRHPKAGSTLLISNQPFCHYQQATAKAYLPQEFYPETVGPGGEIETQHGAVLLDAIARWLYQEALNLGQ